MREPVFNVPLAVMLTLAVLLAVHGWRAMLTPEEDLQVLLLFSLIPARYGLDAATLAQWPGGEVANIWAFLSYAFLHASLTHLIVNALWLLAFGSAVAWRFGTVRFLLFSALCAVAGAGAHLLTHPGEAAPMIGASAAVSGLTAAAVRFVFQGNGPLGLVGSAERGAFLVPAVPLKNLFRDRQVLIFLLVWGVLNVVAGVFSLMAEEGQSIAWQAHIGGFGAGLVLFSLFDPVRSRHQ